MRLEDLSLSHYSRSRLTKDKLQFDKFGGNWCKPRGFWVSVDGKQDWKEWCVNNNFGISRLKYRHRVELSTIANVLHIAHEYQFVIFEKMYEANSAHINSIDWKAVAEKHDGIVIAPYFWSRRLLSLWYYNWDCASGCIWNLDVIASISSIEEDGNEH